MTPVSRQGFSFHRDRRRSIAANNDGSDREVGRLCPGAEAEIVRDQRRPIFCEGTPLGNGDIGLCVLQCGRMRWACTLEKKIPGHPVSEIITLTFCASKSY